MLEKKPKMLLFCIVTLCYFRSLNVQTSVRIYIRIYVYTCNTMIVISSCISFSFMTLFSIRAAETQ
jgi:hypothetical protein